MEGTSKIDAKSLSRPFPVAFKFEKGFSKLTYNHNTFNEIESGLDIRESQIYKKQINISKFSRERDIKTNFNGIMSASISFLDDLAGFKSSLGTKNEKHEKSESNTCYCSINITIEKWRIYLQKKQVVLQPDIEKQIERIINVNANDNEKTLKSLCNYFNDTGYFVPMQIGLGGSIAINFEVSEKKHLEEATKAIQAKFQVQIKEDEEKGILDKIGIGAFLDKAIDELGKKEDDKKDDDKKEKKSDDEEGKDDDKIGGQIKFKHEKDSKAKATDYLKNVKIEVKGGDTSLTNMDFKDISKWVKSINASNSEIISAENTLSLERFFSSDLKDKFYTFGESVKEQMNKPFEALKILVNIPKFEFFEGNKIKGSIQKVFETGFPKAIEGVISVKTIPLNQDGTMFTKNEYVFNQMAADNEIFVGFRIEATRDDDQNGKFVIETLNNREIKLLFISKRFRDQSWIVQIFYINI